MALWKHCQRRRRRGYKKNNMADENSELREVKRLLEDHPSLKIVTNKQDKLRVVCELTSHEMPCTLSSIETYINGKKYKFEKESKLTMEEEELCEKYLVLKKRGQLFCTLTKRHINNHPHHIRVHLNGRRFQKVLTRNTQNLNFERLNAEDIEKETKVNDEGEGVWVPSDSGSESLENELDPDFESDETEEHVDTTKDTYSFDVLDTKNNSTEETSENKVIQKKSKRKHQQEPKKKEDKLRKPEQRKKRKCVM